MTFSLSELRKRLDCYPYEITSSCEEWEALLDIAKAAGEFHECADFSMSDMATRERYIKARNALDYALGRVKP